MFAPETTHAYDSPFFAVFLAAASASAPAGSQIARVASKMSLIAAQVSAVETRTMPSRFSRQRRNVSLPGSLTHTPSAKRPGFSSVTRRPALNERDMQSESSGSTPKTLTQGRTAFTYAETPAARPPPPMGTNTAVRSRPACSRISLPTVPWPAITSGSSNGAM